MLHHTRGIVFHQVKYSETSLIVKIYTEQFGLQSYIIRGIRSKKNLIKPALLQAMTPVEMVVYHKEKKDIQHLKEIRMAFPFKSIPFDIRKSSVIIFLNEVLYSVIREQEPNPDLFGYLYHSISSLDAMEKGISNFHLQFLINLTKYLGFFPKGNYSTENSVFDMQEGVFVPEKITTNMLIPKPYSEYFSRLIVPGDAPFSINPSHRPILLEYLIRYYRVHIPGIKEIKSYPILQSVLNE
jgi:DNA repair protein RecO (recombination protein O)